MGFFDFLTGGDAPEIEQTSTQTGQQSDFLNQILSQLQGLSGQGLTPTGPQQFAGISPLQQQAFAQAGQLGGNFNPSLTQDLMGQSNAAIQQGFQGTDTQSITDAFAPSRQLAQNQFEQNTIPALLERFGASSGGSGALQQQLSQAGGNLSLGLRAQEAPFIGQAALNAPGQQFQGAGLLSQLAGQNAGLNNNILQQLFSAGGLQRGIAQEPLNAQFQAAQQPNQLLSQFGPLALGTQAFQNTQQQQSPGLLQSLLPAFGSFAGSAGGSKAIMGGLSNIGSGIGSFFGGGDSTVPSRALFGL